MKCKVLVICFFEIIFSGCATPFWSSSPKSIVPETSPLVEALPATELPPVAEGSDIPIMTATDTKLKARPLARENLDQEPILQAIEDLKIRVSHLENTTSLNKENHPIQSARVQNDQIIGKMLQVQRAIAGHEYRKANRLIDEILKKDEHLAQAWLLKGSLRYLQADFQGARHAWERCLKINPHETGASAYLGRVYAKLGLHPPKNASGELRHPATTR